MSWPQRRRLVRSRKSRSPARAAFPKTRWGVCSLSLLKSLVRGDAAPERRLTSRTSVKVPWRRRGVRSRSVRRLYSYLFKVRHRQVGCGYRPICLRTRLCVFYPRWRPDRRAGYGKHRHFRDVRKSCCCLRVLIVHTSRDQQLRLKVRCFRYPSRQPVMRLPLHLQQTLQSPNRQCHVHSG